EAAALRKIKVNAWTISDIDLIAVGGFSPLEGFMNEEDYRSVVERMRLKDGTVWSLPVTLSVDETEAESILPGDRIALVGEQDGTVYAIMSVESKYRVDQQVEAQNVFKTTDTAHPGVKKLFERSPVYIGGPIDVVNRPRPEKF